MLLSPKNNRSCALGLLVTLVVSLLCQACSEQEVNIPTSPVPSPSQQVTDSLLLVIDSLRGQCDSVSRELCRLKLIEAERRHQTRCLYDWFVEHHIPAPWDCDGRSIDFTQCER